jgi:hypothetical protein
MTVEVYVAAHLMRDWASYLTTLTSKRSFAPHQVQGDESVGITQSQDMAKNTRPVLTFLVTAPKRKSIAVWE